MAIESYVFEIDYFEGLSSDPRIFERDIWDEVFRRWPMLRTMVHGSKKTREAVAASARNDLILLYRIQGFYAEPDIIDVNAYLCVHDKDLAAAVKLIIG